jgi:hypothetical protein
VSGKSLYLQVFHDSSFRGSFEEVDDPEVAAAGILLVTSIYRSNSPKLQLQHVVSIVDQQERSDMSTSRCQTLRTKRDEQMHKDQNV